ncbi:MAG: hypothetical protein U0670_13445 [Anaerolineae bacterium]
MNALLQGLMDAGLIQFGQFVRDGKPNPVQFHLDLLSSYPDLVRSASLAVYSAVPGIKIDHWLCPADAIPLGMALTLTTDVPLVYDRAYGGHAPDLIGAYDIGHPTALLVNVLDRQNPPSRLIAHARRVGLQIQHLVALIDLENGSLPDGIQCDAVLRFTRVLGELKGAGLLPQTQMMTVFDWMRG